MSKFWRLSFLITILICHLSSFSQGANYGLEQAQALFLKEDYEGAIKQCEYLLAHRLKRDVKDELYYLLALSYLKEGEFKRARENFQILISRFPRSNHFKEAHLGLADSLFLEGRFNGAITKYKEFILSYPKDDSLAKAYYNLARCYQKRGEWAEARSYFNKLSQEYPLSFEAKLANDLLVGGEFYFTVQTGSFVNKDNAMKLQEELTLKGFPAEILKHQRQGRTYYRVRVGRFNSPVEAESTERRLRKEGYPTKIYP